MDTSLNTPDSLASLVLGISFILGCVAAFVWYLVKNLSLMLFYYQYGFWPNSEKYSKRKQQQMINKEVNFRLSCLPTDNKVTQQRHVRELKRLTSLAQEFKYEIPEKVRFYLPSSNN